MRGGAHITGGPASLEAANASVVCNAARRLLGGLLLHGPLPRCRDRMAAHAESLLPHLRVCSQVYTSWPWLSVKLWRSPAIQGARRCFEYRFHHPSLCLAQHGGDANRSPKQNENEPGRRSGRQFCGLPGGRCARLHWPSDFAKAAVSGTRTTLPDLAQRAPTAVWHHPLWTGGHCSFSRTFPFAVQCTPSECQCTRWHGPAAARAPAGAANGGAAAPANKSAASPAGQRNGGESGAASCRGAAGEGGRRCCRVAAGAGRQRAAAAAAGLWLTICWCVPPAPTTPAPAAPCQ